MSAASAKVAVLAVRHGKLPVGALELAADANEVLLVGTGVAVAAVDLGGVASAIWGVETGAAHVATWARVLCVPLAGALGTGDRVVVMLPTGSDAAVLGAGLAQCLGWPFIAGAIEVSAGRAMRLLADGITVEELAIDGSFVATVSHRQVSSVPSAGPGSDIGRWPDDTASPAEVVALEEISVGAVAGSVLATQGSVESLGELPAVVATMDLADAERIVAAGAGLGQSERLGLLAAVGERIGAAMGATRVLADRGWISHRRQIGTTGVSVNPRLYLAFGISGASQHTSGLGQPDHVVSVNTDASCPMMAMADLAVVADAPEVLIELARLLGVEAP